MQTGGTADCLTTLEGISFGASQMSSSANFESHKSRIKDGAKLCKETGPVSSKQIPERDGRVGHDNAPAQAKLFVGDPESKIRFASAQAP